MNNAFIYTDAKLTFLIGQCKTWPLFLPVSLNELNFIASCRTVVFPFCHMHIAVGASSKTESLPRSETFIFRMHTATAIQTP